VSRIGVTRRSFAAGGIVAVGVIAVSLQSAWLDTGRGQAATNGDAVFRQALVKDAGQTCRPPDATSAAVSQRTQGDREWKPLPLAFVENRGQWNTLAHYVARRGNLTVRAERDAIVLQLVEPRHVEAEQGRFAGAPGQPTLAVVEPATRRGVVVRLAFENAASGMQIRADRLLPGYCNYFLGNDPARWQSRVPGYAVVTYAGLQDGVDLVLHELDGRLEYDVCLAPGADLERVVIRCEGIEDLHLGDEGSLVLDTVLGPIVQAAPRTWEEDAEGRRFPVACRYRLFGEQAYGFAVEGRQAARRLVIDPGLTWATYLGGVNTDFPGHVVVAGNGDVILAGSTDSPNYPTTPGVFDAVGNATFLSADQVVTRLTAGGDALVYSTFVGGTGDEGPHGIFFDEAERVTLAGSTTSSDHPTTPGAYQSVFAGQNSDAVVAQLSATGDSLLYSTFLGGFNPGSGSEVAFDIAVRSDGTLIVSGVTCASDFPITVDALDPTFMPLCDGFISVLDPSASGAAQLVYSTFLFGGGPVFLNLEPDGSVLVLGDTLNPAFPTTPGAMDTQFLGVNGGFDGIVCRLSPDLKTILASTFMKTSFPLDVAFAPPGSITVGVNIVHESLITAGAYDTTYNGAIDVVVGRLSAALDEWEWGTFIGGSSGESANGIAVDPSGAVIITGGTASANYPVTPGAHDTVYSGGLGDAFVSYLSADGSQLLYSTFLGESGSSSMRGQAAAAIGVAEAVVAGDGAKTAFPVTPGAFDTTYNGGGLGGDGFVVKLPLTLAWDPVGTGIAGTLGVPKLQGQGLLCAGNLLTLTLTRGKPNGVATLVIGLSLLHAPFKGGTLIPAPDLLIGGLPISAGGSMALSAPWPAGIPEGFTFHFQAWIPDTVAVQGLAASNGLSATTL